MVDANISLEQLTPEPQGKSHGGCGSCGTGRAGDGSRCGNGLEKIYPTTAVRFGYMRYIGEFTHPPEMKFSCGAKVVIQTRRGIEMGEQVSLTCSGCDKSVTRDQMREWVQACGEDSFIFDAGRILREATSADLAEYAHIQAGGREKRRLCQQLADQEKLPIRVVDCECPFGGERIVFYFTSGERVDFRGLVRDLTREYRTRIEMRQVGARDEARLVADFETCGREVCCKVFLKTLRPISMRMAKLQKATLDPSQVSGRCGRLKCCLRYEHVGYEELDRKLPKVGVRVSTSHGDGVIVNRQVLTQLVQIRADGGTLLTVVAEDITAVGVPAPAILPQAASERPERRPPSRPPGPPKGTPLRDLAQQPPAPVGPLPPHPQPTRQQIEPTKTPTRSDIPGQQESTPPHRRRGRRRRGGRRPGQGPPGSGTPPAPPGASPAS